MKIKLEAWRCTTVSAGKLCVTRKSTKTLLYGETIQKSQNPDPKLTALTAQTEAQNFLKAKSSLNLSFSIKCKMCCTKFLSVKMNNIRIKLKTKTYRTAT